jgi:hypothetical protein
VVAHIAHVIPEIFSSAFLRSSDIFFENFIKLK